MTNGERELVVCTRLSVLALLLSLPVSTPAQQLQPTFLAVVDGQGLLTPIAVYDGTTWWNRWPWASQGEGVRSLPLPPSLAAVPADWLPPGVRVPITWQALTPVTRVPFRALRPAWPLEPGLMETVTVATTYRGNPYEEDTPAISGPGVLDRLVSLSDTEHETILSQLHPRIAALEAEEIARWKKQMTEAGQNDIALTRTYRVTGPSGTRYVSTPPRGEERDYGLLKGPSPIGARTYEYLRGEKLFTLRPDAECVMNLTTRGFLVVDQRGRVESEKLGASAFAEYCGDSAETTHHLATVTIGRRTWWLAKFSLEDGSDYGLIDPLPGEEVVMKGRWGQRLP